MDKRVRRTIAVVMLVSIFSLANAEELIKEKGITVVGKRLGSLEKYSGNVSIYSQEDIKKYGYENLVDFLQFQEGVWAIADMSGVGNERTGQLSMRGFNGEKTSVLVVIDGVKVNDPNNNRVFWDRIPLSNIEKVEVLKGGASTVYGSGSLAGVVVITTKKNKHDDIKIMSGSNRAQEFAINKSLVKNDKVSIGLNYNNFSEDSFRQNDLGYGSEVIDLKTAILLTDIETLDLSYTSSRTKYGFSGYSPDYGSYLNYPNRRQGSAGWGLGRDAYYEEGMDGGYLAYSKQLNRNTLVKVNLNSIGRVQDSDLDTGSGVYRTNMYNNNFVSEVAVNDVMGDSLILGTEYGSSFVNANSHPAPASNASQTEFLSNAFYLENSYSLANIGVVFGYREDVIKVDYNNVFGISGAQTGALIFRGYSPKVSLVYNFNEHDNVYTSWSKSFKAPPHEDFATSVAPYESNTDIQPQSSIEVELGVKKDFGDKLFVKTALYESKVKDEYMYNPNTWQNDNIDTIHRGVELSLSKKINKTNINLSYAANRAYFNENSGNLFVIGNFIPLVPDFKWDLSLINNLTAKDSLSLAASYMGAYYAQNNIANTNRKEKGYGLIDLGFAHRESNDFDYRVDIKNILNERISAYTTYDVGGDNFQYYPMAGRTIKVTMEYEL